MSTIGMTVEYLGSLRCEGKHLKSGNLITTDAPTDNKGKGEAFSPTDLMCTSLACCMITIMGIAADEKEIVLSSVNADIEKIMGTNPRRVVGINIHLKIGAKELDQRKTEILKNAALTCPVAKSLHPDLVQNVSFEFLEEN